MTLKINKEHVNKKILFINGISDDGDKNEEINYLDSNDCEIFINNNYYKEKKYFIPKKEGEYIVKIVFKKKLKDLLSKLLIEDPDKRISWEEYFKHDFFK